MNILVHSKTLPVTDSIRTFVGRQVRKVAKLSGKVLAVNVFLDTVKTSRGLNQLAEAKIRVIVPGKNVMVRSRAHDLYLAISQAMADAAQALRKRKERYLTKRAWLRPRARSAHERLSGLTNRLALR